LAAVLLLAPCGQAVTQEHEHGAPERLGQVHFSTSCNDSVQGGFDRAVAYLHSFQFSSAIDGFNTALRGDPSCAIAYWGIALSYWGNPFAPGIKDATLSRAGRESAERGTARVAKTERERAYIAAVAQLYGAADSIPQPARLRAYRDSMGKIAASYPNDGEAQIFYALALSAAADPADKTYADQLRAGAILEKLFEEQPDHPGLAHYIVHAYDVPALADRALGAARRYAQIAPDAPHALHMPSHTFTRLGYWQESIESNVAAAAAARRQGQTAEELHASDYEAYAYLQTGQDSAAVRIVGALPEIASRFDPKAALVGAGPPAAGYFALAAIPARYALERQDWQQAQELTVRQTPFPYADALTWFARGMGSARLGHAATADEANRALTGLRQRLVQAGETYWAKQVQIEEVAVAAWSSLAAGNKDQALQQMRTAVELEDTTEKSAITPGPLAPAHELLGEMLLHENQPEEALKQFEATLEREPRRFRALYGAAHAAQLTGNQVASRRYFAELVKVCAAADTPGRHELQEARKALLEAGG
jgi:hypothetical protein